MKRKNKQAKNWQVYYKRKTQNKKNIKKKTEYKKNKMIKLQKCRKYILYILYRHLNMKTKGEEQTKK